MKAKKRTWLLILLCLFSFLPFLSSFHFEVEAAEQYTYGNTLVGDFEDVWSGSWLVAGNFSASSGAKVVSVSAYLHLNYSGSIKYALYNTTADGAGYLIAETANVSCGTTFLWINASFPSPLQVPGGQYWIVPECGDVANTISYKYSNDSSALGYSLQRGGYSRTGWDFPDSFDDVDPKYQYDDVRPSYYITYETPTFEPIAIFTWAPYFLLVGDTVAFNASTSVVFNGSHPFFEEYYSASITQYIWDFGDGSEQTVYVPTVTHSYSAFGNYTVTLILKNNYNVYSTAVSHTLDVNLQFSPGWLHVSGSKVKDEYGNTIATRAITNWAWSLTTEQFLDNCGDHGVNFVGLAFNFPDYNFGSQEYILDVSDAGNLTLLNNILDWGVEHHIYVGLVYLMGSTYLASEYGLNYTAVTSMLITEWSPILTYLEDDTRMTWIKPLDEPNYDGPTEELYLWNNTIGALRQINPYLIWVPHTINVYRFWSGNLPWTLTSMIPYENIAITGGQVLNQYNSYFDPEAWNITDYIGWYWWPNGSYVYEPTGDSTLDADLIANNTFRWVNNFRGSVLMPVGTTSMVTEEGFPYPTWNSRTYLLKKLIDWHEANQLFMMPYVSDYQLDFGGDDGEGWLDQYFNATSGLYWEVVYLPPAPGDPGWIVSNVAFLMNLIGMFALPVSTIMFAKGVKGRDYDTCTFAFIIGVLGVGLLFA